MSEPYQRPAGPQRIELEVRHSRFICHVAQTPGVAAAQAFIERIRTEHPDANHNCWCHVAGAPADYNFWNCSDDGEPKGTAGKPMLKVLTHSGLGEITVVVTRYFGGIKLGAGGLVRAYSQAVQAGLAEVEREIVVPTHSVQLRIPHSLTGTIEQLLRQQGLEVLARHWGDCLGLSLALTDDQLAELRRRLGPYPDIQLGLVSAHV